MSDKKYNYPVFETLELTTEAENQLQPYELLKPAQTGDSVNAFAHLLNNPQNNNRAGQVFQQNQSVIPQLKKIQVVYFYSGRWGQASLGHLKQLNAIRNEIKYQDGSLLIIDDDGENSKLQHTLWLNNLQLNVYTDTDNRLASLFGIYSDKSPAWSRYAGLDSNVPLPGVFVLNHFAQVLFAFANHDIVSTIPVNEITSTVYQGNNYLAGRKSA